MYTFTVAFDKPTPVSPMLTGRPDLMIGTRMLFQLHEAFSWDGFLANPHNHVTSSAALTRLATVVDKERKQLCIIIYVGDMHTLQHEIGSRTSHTSAFIVALDSLRALVNASDCLVTVLLSTSRSQQMMGFHHSSIQRTRYLWTAILASNGQRLQSIC